jgi:ABC-type sugar transport system substrate-binding protein
VRRRIDWSVRGLAIALAVFGIAVAVTACGGGGSSSSGGTTAAGETETDASASGGSASGASAEGLAYAAKKVEEASKPPTHIGPTVPIKKPIPTGKTIVSVNCGAESCSNTEEGLKEAAAVLGWKVKTINAEPTPQAIQQAYEAALREHPDGVTSLGQSKESFERQLKQMEEEGIPFVSAYGPDPEGDGITLQIVGPLSGGKAETDPAMKLLADKAIVDSKGEGEIGVAVLTGFPTPAEFAEAFEEEITEHCPKCSTKQIEIAPTAIGKTSETELVNFLQANPEIHYLFLTYEALATGLAQAAKANGLEAPKTYSWAPVGLGDEALRTGESTAAVPQGEPELGWQIADAFARIFTGENPQDSKKLQPWTLWGQSVNNLPPEGENPPIIVGFQKQFEELWGK